MKTFLFLLSFLHSLFLPVSQPVDQPWGEHLKTPKIVVSRTATQFQTPNEWFDDQNLQLMKTAARQHTPDLNMNLVQSLTINGKSILLLTIPLDMGDSKGNTVYRNHPAIAIFEHGEIWLVSGS